jgi:ABC-type amino acid transport substrate-binding protein
MASFSQKRAKYTYYIPNSLKAKDILVSKAGLKEIVGIENIKGRLLVGKGDSKENIDKKYPNIKVVKINKKEFKKGIKFLRQNKADFITTQEKKLQYYLKTHNTSLKKLNIMMHKNALSLNSKNKHLIFSRKSKFFKELPNPNYDKSKPISIKNFPTIISKDCVAYKLMNVLKQMKEDGTTQKLVNKYFK